MSLVTALRDALLPTGLNLVAAVPAELYDRDVPERYRLRKRYPGVHSLIVIGNGGAAFWIAFRAYCDGHPDFVNTEADPLDAYTTRVIEAQVPPILVRHDLEGRVLYPFRFDTEPVSFIHLGAIAGFGARSLLGVLVHPEYGPWVALRAALVLDVAIEPITVANFDPCGTCAEKPCISACPVGAVSERGWDVPRCAAHRAMRLPAASGFPLPLGEGQGEGREAALVASSPHPNPLPEGEGAESGDRPNRNCADRCDARWHCVYGRAHRYPADALAYHQRRALDAMRRFHA